MDNYIASIKSGSYTATLSTNGGRMLSRTLNGVIAKKKKNKLTIILETNTKVTFIDKDATLEIGDKCHVAYNEVTNEIVNVFRYDELNVNQLSTPPHKEYYPNRRELREVLGDSEFDEFEDWE